MPGVEDWIRVCKLLDSKGIKRLYHFTDKENISSIRESGGLLSWRILEERGIKVRRPGGDLVSHMIDHAIYTDKYVHLCFSKNQYSLEAAIKSGRIKDPVILEISLDALRGGEPVFSNQNSASTCNDAFFSSGVAALSHIHIDTAIREDIYEIPFDERRFHQAEVLVQNRIPLSYIVNIDSLIDEDTPRLIVFIVDHSRSTSQKTMLDGKEVAYASDAISTIVNDQIYSLVKQCVEDTGIRNRYDISVIGYGDSAYNAWQSSLGTDDFYSPDKLYSFLMKDKPSFMTIDDYFNELSKSIWVAPNHSGWKTRTDYAFKRAKKLIESWVSNHSAKCDPPVVIHITDGDFSGGIEVNEARLLAESIMDIKTERGQTSIWNFHINPRHASPVLLPDIIDAGRLEESVRRLYEFSSDIPIAKNHIIEEMFNVESTFARKALSVNTDMDTLRKLLKLACI